MKKRGIAILLMLTISCGKSNPKGSVDYYEDGYAKSIHNFNNEGKLNGLSVWFYSNGFIRQQQTFKNGLAHGNAYYFYPDGALKSRRFFKDDKLDGFRTDYFDDSIGLIKAVILYKAGKITDVRKGDSAQIDP